MNIFHDALLLLKSSIKERSMSLQVGVFIFFALFAVIIIGISFLVMSFSGAFDISELRHSTWLDAEILHHQNNISNDYSRLSLRGVALARTLSSHIQAWTNRNGITEKEIASHPGLIENLLADQIGTLLAVLENSICSGVFIILEATVNPSAENAHYSRAGIFLKRTELNTINSISAKLYCLRGPASVARANSIELMGQWRMEFNIDDMDFYEKVLETARKNTGTDLSRLYYWSKRYLMTGNSEDCMLLFVPLIARDGTVYGTCGIEVSSMLFKRLYSPDNTQYPRVFTAFGHLQDDTFNTEAGLVAGNSYLTSQTSGLLTVEKGSRRTNIASWRSEDGSAYTGRMETVRLYPADSPFANETWALSLFMPDSDWNAAVRQGNNIFYATVLVLLAASSLAAVYISRRFIHPMVSTLESIKSGSLNDLRKTQISEIDDFLAYIAALAEERKKSGAAEEALESREPQPDSHQSDGLQSFAFEKLTVQELNIAELTLRGYSYTDISKTLKLKPNTVKWYQKILYSKLGINSKRELFELALEKSRASN